MEFTIHRREKPYLVCLTIISLIVYGVLCAVLYRGYVLQDSSALKIGWYIVGFAIFKLLGSLFFVGYLKGNAIKVNHYQFSDVYEMLESHAQQLGIKTPDMYLLQHHGMLNAFATRIFQRDYVVLYSDILELAYQEGKDVVSFIIGHELGHIKRKHTGFFKTMFLLPARIIPIVGDAYSRACEYTCDNIGYALCPTGAVRGILLLAAGKKLYNKINIDELMLNMHQETKFVIGFAELFSSHPALIKRIGAMHALSLNQVVPQKLSFTSPVAKIN